MAKHTDTVISNNDAMTSNPAAPAPLLVRMVSAGAFVLLCTIALVLPVPPSLYVKSASGLVLLAGCFVFFANGSRLLAPGIFLALAYLTRCLPFYSLFLMLALPLALYGLMVRFLPALHAGHRGFVMGNINKGPLVVTIVVTVMSVAGLVTWYALGNVDFSGFTDAFRDRGTAAVVLGGLLFSVINAFVSEAVFRGVVWQGIEECFPKALPIVLIQGLLYGVSHYWGALPNGWEGAILSGVFGLFLGMIRLFSGGLFFPMIAHLCADLTLLILVLHTLGRF